MDANVLFHISLLEEKLGKLETTHMPGPHVICGILSPSVFVILVGKRLISLRGMYTLVALWQNEPFFCTGICFILACLLTLHHLYEWMTTLDTLY